MHSSTVLKGIIFVLFLCCHLHLSTAKPDVGKKVADKVVNTGILGGISSAATHAAATVTRPFYKFFIEGGTGLVSRYFTLNDYFGIGQSIRKNLVKTATVVGKTGWHVGGTVGTAVKKFAKKRLQEQAEEMNRWWTRQTMEAINSIKSGIAGGVAAGVGSVVGGNVIDKITGGSGSTGENFSGSGSDVEASTTTTTTSTTTTTTTTTTTSNPFGVSISDPMYAKPWGIGGSGGSSSLSSVFDIFGNPDNSDSSVSNSQVVIGQPVGEQTGEADTSSTVTRVKDPFNWMSGASASGDGSSESSASGGFLSILDSSDSDSGCNRRCRKEKARRRQNNRRSRSADNNEIDPLEAAFVSVARKDPQQCLPLVLCAIHADPQGLLTPKETKLVNVFRPLVIHRHAPEWAEPWVRGARQGASALHGKAEQGSTTCRKTFPNCPFSAHYLRSLMAKTFGVDPQNDESREDVHLELNLV